MRKSWPFHLSEWWKNAWVDLLSLVFQFMKLVACGFNTNLGVLVSIWRMKWYGTASRRLLDWRNIDELEVPGSCSVKGFFNFEQGYHVFFMLSSKSNNRVVWLSLRTFVIWKFHSPLHCYKHWLCVLQSVRGHLFLTLSVIVQCQMHIVHTLWCWAHIACTTDSTALHCAYIHIMLLCPYYISTILDLTYVWQPAWWLGTV